MARSPKPKSLQDLLNESHSSSGGASLLRIVRAAAGGVALENTAANVFSSSTARTATQTSTTYTNYGMRGLRLTMRVLTGDSSAAITPTLSYRDAAGTYSDVLNSTAVTSTAAAVYEYFVYPGGSTKGVGTSVKKVLGLPLAFQYRVGVTHGSTRSRTYSMRIERLV